MKNQTVSSEKEILILLQSGKPREKEEPKERKGGGQKGQQPLGEVRFTPAEPSATTRPQNTLQTNTLPFYLSKLTHREEAYL